MDNNIPNRERLARNTLLLYFRMFLLMTLSLYTTRVVLNGLGVSDYGLYNVVAGFVGMLAFMSSALGNATQRFLAFEMPKNNLESLALVFNQIRLLHFLLAISVFIIAETVGIWFVNNGLNIDDRRMNAANWVYQFSVVSVMLSIICVPYNALLIAHENMKVFAYVSLLEGLFKLLICFVFFMTTFDNLIIYSFLLSIVSIIVSGIYAFYCKNKYKETSFPLVFAKKKAKEIGGYSVWSLFGTISTMAVTQGVNILVNLFFGTVVNAARGVSYQIENAVKTFITNFQTAMNPQIVKSYSMGEMEMMESLIAFGSKISFFIMYIISVPIIVNISYILQVWLGKIPEYTIEFTRLALINTLFATFSGALSISVQATGKIRLYQIVMGTLLFLNFPITYLLFKLGLLPYVTVISSTIIEIICLLFRLKLSNRLYNLNIRNYSKLVFSPALLCVGVTTPVVILLKFYINGNNFISVLVNVILSLAYCAFIIYFIGFTANQRSQINLYVIKVKNKILR